MTSLNNVGDVVSSVSATGLIPVAKQIGTNNKYLSKALKTLGYQSIQGKGWQYTGEGEAPTKMPLDELLALCKKGTNVVKVSKSNTDITPVTKSNTNVTTVTESNTLPTALLTNSDVTDLLTMLTEWRANKSNLNVIEVTETIFDRIQMLSKNPTTRKTYVIDAAIADSFDDYCAKKNINKSNAIAIALQDFLNKY